MAKREAPRDLFMNFAGIPAVTHATDSSVVQETQIHTGLSIRGALIWLVHLVEVAIHEFTANINNVTIAVCTRSGLTVMPDVHDNGVLTKVQARTSGVWASGLAQITNPIRNSYLPPVPLAAPQLSVYTQSSIDHADGRGKDASVRICFTTAPLDAQAYTEIAEAWGW